MTLMRRCLAFASLFLLLAGCDGGEPRRKTAEYPPLDESPPPPMPEVAFVAAPGGEEEQAVSESGYAVEETGGGWVDQVARGQQQAQELRQQAKQSSPDDPFALSEEAIDELSKQHGVILY